MRIRVWAIPQHYKHFLLYLFFKSQYALQITVRTSNDIDGPRHVSIILEPDFFYHEALYNAHTYFLWMQWTVQARLEILPLSYIVHAGRILHAAIVLWYCWIGRSIGKLYPIYELHCKRHAALLLNLSKSSFVRSAISYSDYCNASRDSHRVWCERSLFRRQYYDYLFL